MLKARQIFVSAMGLAVFGVGLAGCGQRGPLYLPTDPAAANRATLPQVLLPTPSRSESATQPQPQGDKPAGETNNQNNPTTNTPR
ncbi:MAG: lipoprotein [Proteobacteria bacterium]|nr:lipoprotein [Pseudomonadota bacterium]